MLAGSILLSGCTSDIFDCLHPTLAAHAHQSAHRVDTLSGCGQSDEQQSVAAAQTTTTRRGRGREGAQGRQREREREEGSMREGEPTSSSSTATFFSIPRWTPEQRQARAFLNNKHRNRREVASLPRACRVLALAAPLPLLLQTVLFLLLSLRNAPSPRAPLCAPLLLLLTSPSSLPPSPDSTRPHPSNASAGRALSLHHPQREKEGGGGGVTGGGG